MSANQTLLDTIAQLLGTTAAAATIFGGPQGAAIGSVLSLAGSALARGVAATADLAELNAEIQAMVDAGEEPTQDQWDAMHARSAAADARIAASRPQAEDVINIDLPPEPPTVIHVPAPADDPPNA